MRKREDLPIEKHTVNFFVGDYQKLQALYPRLGAGKAIRDIVHAHLRLIEENAQQKMPLVRELDIELEAPNEQ